MDVHALAKFKKNLEMLVEKLGTKSALGMALAYTEVALAEAKGEEITTTDIKDRHQISQTTAFTYVNSLGTHPKFNKLGLVTLEASQYNMRSKTVALSMTGKGLAQCIT